MKRVFLFLPVALLTPLFGLAHEGHGHTHGFTIKHYFVEPEHLALVLLALAAAVFFARNAAKAWKQKSL